MKKKKVIYKDIVIIGAGASGLMYGALNPKKEFVILESNKNIGLKIKISGGGKCNITNKNLSADRYLGKSDFIKDVINSVSYSDLLNFFENIEFIKKKNDQFFCKNSARDILNFFENKIEKSKIYLNNKVKDVEYLNEKFIIYTNNNVFEANKLFIASGGLSFPDLGASDIAFKIANKFGHKVRTLKPALVGFTVQKDEFWMKKLSGLSVYVKLKVANKEFIDNLLFAHKGITGPVVLNSSLYWEKGLIEIDFLPDRSLTLKDKNKLISSNLPLPKRFVKEFLNSIDIDDKPVYKLKKDEFEKLKLLKSYRFAPAGNFGYRKAEVTKGGILVDDVSSKNMESKLQNRLYFLGECLDVTGELGGFNLHFAFSSAYEATFYYA